MITWLIIALALCIVCGVGLAIIARRRKHKQLKTKIVYMADTPTAVYVFEEGATKNKGRVWKCDYSGPQFSNTGFDGPYTVVSDFPNKETEGAK